MTMVLNGKFHMARGRESRREMRTGEAPKRAVGRVPRAAKLMALALRFDQLIRDGVVADQADVARLGRVTRARVTQIMNMLNLASDIQEAILCLPKVEAGHDPVSERDLRPIAAEADWRKQRQMWAQLMGGSHASAKTG